VSKTWLRLQYLALAVDTIVNDICVATKPSPPNPTSTTTDPFGVLIFHDSPIRPMHQINHKLCTDRLGINTANGSADFDRKGKTVETTERITTMGTKRSNQLGEECRAYLVRLASSRNVETNPEIGGTPLLISSFPCYRAANHIGRPPPAPSSAGLDPVQSPGIR